MAKPKVKTVVVWILAILLGAAFLMGAVAKLQGGEAMKARFADWGYSAGFLLLIGILEGLGGLCLAKTMSAFRINDLREAAGAA